MAYRTLQRRLVAVLAADAVGYSSLMERDEAAALAALKAARRDALEPAVATFRGRIIKTTGDGILAEFPSVTDAVEAAVRIQQSLARLDANLLAFRIGINIGDVIVEDGDIYGDGVNVASRLEAMCQPGGLLVARAAFE